MNLGAALKESPQKARAAVAEIIGHVQLDLCGEDGKEAWAEMQTDRLAEVATGRSISVVAGAGFELWAMRAKTPRLSQ